MNIVMINPVFMFLSAVVISELLPALGNVNIQFLFHSAKFGHQGTDPFPPSIRGPFSFLTESKVIHYFDLP